MEGEEGEEEGYMSAKEKNGTFEWGRKGNPKTLVSVLKREKK